MEQSNGPEHTHPRSCRTPTGETGTAPDTGTLFYGLRQHLIVTGGSYRAKLRAMSEPVSSIRNLGPAFQESFAKVGIHTAEQLRDLGADAAYEMLLRSGHRPHFIGYYVLVMGLQGRPWNDCKGAEKKALRVKFDAMKARAFDPVDAEFERLMDQIGIRTLES
jgi:DNA transformation protein